MEWSGLASWIVCGAAIGLLIPLTVRSAKLGRFVHLGLSLLGALAGGAVATSLGFGGLSSLDWRSAATASLTAAVLCLGAEVAAR